MAPVSIKVLNPLKAYVQSALEKKSAFTLKEPQSVQIKGKIDIVSQNNIKILFTIIICFEYLLIVWFIYLSVLNSFQVLISTGVSKKAIPNIVNIDVAPAEPKSILFSFLKS